MSKDWVAILNSIHPHAVTDRTTVIRKNNENNNKCENCEGIRFDHYEDLGIKACILCGVCKKHYDYSYQNIYAFAETHCIRKRKYTYNRNIRMNRLISNTIGLPINIVHTLISVFKRNKDTIKSAFDKYGRKNLNYNFIIHIILNKTNNKQYLYLFPTGNSKSTIRRNVNLAKHLFEKIYVHF